MDSLKDHFRRGIDDPLKLVDQVALPQLIEQNFLFFR
ncbi:hypothetical protein Thivi_3101 [Thiocystis violascens DSM 198]|uniref:Uncharacterized protein n=1 Tax=Thiocystis violascens (strain ATCC 17096 / DSM 198 / 6111) TaxID=765911 RepID=I3YDB1_THIV6|nr:hypothetical protein Thivi_3101 [Thiocystis violascens DSM 198]